MRPLCGVLVLSALLTPPGLAQTRSVPAGSASISGRILTSSLQPIAGATIVLGLFDGDPLKSEAWWATTSDQNGIYEFADLPPGRFTLTAARDGYAGWASIPTAAPPQFALRGVPALVLATGAPRTTVDLVPRGRAPDINLTLHRPSSISGHLVRQDGSPAGDSSVTLYMVDEAGTMVSRRGRPTDANGAYRFDDLRPGTYYLGPPQSPLDLPDVDLRWLPAVTLSEGASVSDIDVAIGPDIAFSITGRIVDASLQVPRILHVEYAVPGENHRGLVTVFDSDGSFRVPDQNIKPGPLVFLASARNDDGPLVGRVTVTTIEGPNEVEIVVAKPGGLRGRVAMEGGGPFTLGARFALARVDFTPLGASDPVIEAAPDGWLEADDLIGEYRILVVEPQMWTVKSIRHRGVRQGTDRLVIRNAEVLDDLEILIGPR